MILINICEEISQKVNFFKYKKIYVLSVYNKKKHLQKVFFLERKLA
jgi:hypothetical protein